MHGIRILFIFAFAKELISYPFYPFTILIVNIQKMENLGSVLWRADNVLPLVFSLANYTMQLNPASDYMTFSFELPEPQLSAKLTVSDALGKVVFQQDVNTENGQILWDTRSLANGNYIYTLKSNSEVLDQGLLSVVK
jgi:hypothetical protein